MYRLHSFCQSGPAFKVAFLLRALDQPWEPVFVDFMNGATREASWRESANEMGEVPVLEFDMPAGPRRLTQSGVILTYLAKKARHARTRWLGWPWWLWRQNRRRTARGAALAAV